MFRRERRQVVDLPTLVQQYRTAGFTPEQSRLLASKIIDRRKPWRREVMMVALLTLAFATGGWIKVGSQNDKIQDSRLQACEDTNDRHDATLDTLNDILDHAVKAHPERKAQIERSRATTTLLINALVPLRNCQEFIQ